MIRLSFLVFTCFWLISDSYVRLPRSLTYWQSLTRYYDASEDGSTSFIDDDKRSGALQPSMTDIRAASAGTSNRPLSNEGLNILSVTSLGFLKNIEEYGKARMARKAVGILSKMQSYGEMPVQEHYTAAVCACQQSDQFEQCISVFQEMKAQRINPTVQTYDHLISCAEKTGHWQAALALFDEMVHDFQLVGSTSIYVSCMWAAEQGGRHDISLDLLTDMEQRGVPRDLATYAACAYSCERAGQGTVALHVMDLMRQDGIEVDTPVYKAVIWACVKGNMWQKALEIFDRMETEGIPKDEACFHGAIWACTNGGLWERAVDLLKAMKSKHSLPRNTIAYDGALTALQQAGQWEACVDMLSWMDREQPVTSPSSTTYQVIIQVTSPPAHFLSTSVRFLWFTHKEMFSSNNDVDLNITSFELHTYSNFILSSPNLYDLFLILTLS